MVGSVVCLLMVLFVCGLRLVGDCGLRLVCLGLGVGFVGLGFGCCYYVLLVVGLYCMISSAVWITVVVSSCLLGLVLLVVVVRCALGCVWCADSLLDLTFGFGF